jgi:ABC-type transport system involved in cytochrome c biogenesis permease component
MAALVGIMLLIVAPCAIAAWLGSRVRLPIAAFLLTWLATPFLTVLFVIVFTPLMAALMDVNNDGTWAIMIPIYSVGIGFIVGIVAAIVVRRRQQGSAD